MGSLRARVVRGWGGLDEKAVEGMIEIVRKDCEGL